MASSSTPPVSTTPQIHQLENPTSILYNLPYEIRQMILKAALVCTPYSIALGPKDVVGFPENYDGYDYQKYEGYQSDEDVRSIFENSDGESEDSDEGSDGEDEYEEMDMECEVPAICDTVTPRILHLEAVEAAEHELETVYKNYQFGPYPLKDIDDVGSHVQKRINRSAAHKLHQSRIADEARLNKFWRCWCEYTGSSSGGLFRVVEKPAMPVQILRVSRRFYEEGIDILYGKNRFLVHNILDLQYCMVDMVDAKTLQRIKNIGFTSSSPLAIKLRDLVFRQGETLARSLPIYYLRGYDVVCWYNLRNLKKIDFFFSWYAALRDVSLRADVTLERLCLSIEYTARSIAAHLMQDFKGCRDKLAAEGKALCCNDGGPIYDWDLYLESKIFGPTDGISNNAMTVEDRGK